MSWPARRQALSFADASCREGGCCAAGDEAGACWEEGADVLDGELAALCLSLSHALSQEGAIRLRTDSRSALHWLRVGEARRFRTSKGKHRPRTERLVSAFGKLVEEAGREVEVEWVPRASNSVADAASRRPGCGPPCPAFRTGTPAECRGDVLRLVCRPAEKTASDAKTERG